LGAQDLACRALDLWTPNRGSRAKLLSLGHIFSGALYFCTELRFREPLQILALSSVLIRSLSKVIGKSKIHGLDSDGFKVFGEDICAEIGKIVNVRLPVKGSAYTDLVNWITGISRDHPIEIFTTNYDLLGPRTQRSCSPSCWERSVTRPLPPSQAKSFRRNCSW
jgi:hypothetical protein